MGGSPPELERIGPFELTSTLGRRGLATRYTAEARAGQGPSRKVVLHVLRAADVPGGARALLQRAAVLKPITHASLVRILAAGEDAGRIFVATEQLDGLDLASLAAVALREGGGVPVDVALQLLLQASQGLAALHKAEDEEGRPLGLAHGGVTAERLIVRRDGRLKLVDAWLPAEGASPLGDLRALASTLSELARGVPLPETAAAAVARVLQGEGSPTAVSFGRALAGGLGELSHMTSLGTWLEPLFAAWAAGPPSPSPAAQGETVPLAVAGQATVELPAARPPRAAPPVDERTATVTASTFDEGRGDALPGPPEEATRALVSPSELGEERAGELSEGGTVARLPDHVDSDGTVARLPDHVDDGATVAVPPAHLGAQDLRPAAPAPPPGGDAPTELLPAASPLEAPPWAPAAPADRRADATLEVPMLKRTPTPGGPGGADEAPTEDDGWDAPSPSALPLGPDVPTSPAAPRTPPDPAPAYGAIWNEDEDFGDTADPPVDPGVPMMSADEWQQQSWDAWSPPAETDAPPPPDVGAGGTARLPAAPPPPAPAAPFNFVNVGLVALGTVCLGLMLALVNWLASPDSDDWLDDADDAADEGQVDKALRLYGRALGDSDLDDDDRLSAHRAMLKLTKGEKMWAEAAEHARFLAEAEDATVDDKLEWARLLDQSMAWANAVPVWDAIAQSPDAPPKVRLSAAETLLDRGAFMEAQAALQAFNTGDDALTAQLLLMDLALRRGDGGRAAQLASGALAAYPGEPRALAVQGEVAALAGRYGDADARYQEALRQDPSSVAALLGEARIQARRGQRDAAASALSRAEASGDARVPVALGLLLAEDARRRKVTDVDQALVACTRARDMAGDGPRVMDCEAVALMVQGDHERSQQLLEKARKAGAGIPEIWRHRALYDLAQGDPVSALEMLREARQRFPDRPDLLILEAKVLISRDDLAGAMNLLNPILEASPDHPEAKVEVAAVRALQGRWGDARGLLREVIDQEPRDLDARYALADTFLATGDGVAAQREYEAIVALDAAQAFAQVRLAAIHAVQGQSGQALSRLGKALQLGYPKEAVREDPAFFGLGGDPGWRELMGE